MSQDFAKRKKGTARKTPTVRKSAGQKGHGEAAGGTSLRTYLAGVISGVFFSFIAYLTTLPGPAAPAQQVTDSAPKAEEIPKPRFDFYTLLPKQTLEVDLDEQVEPAADIRKPPVADSQQQLFVLQAGSFRQQKDAERRRAELLLLGLEPTIEESQSDTGRWFRVYLGPFASQKAMTKARGLTAHQNIDTLVLRRTRD